MRPDIASSFFVHGLYLVSIPQFMKYLPIKEKKKSVGNRVGYYPGRQSKVGLINSLKCIKYTCIPQPDIPLAYSVTCMYSVKAGAPRAGSMQVIER